MSWTWMVVTNMRYKGLRKSPHFFPYIWAKIISFLGGE